MDDYISREAEEQFICEVCERPGCPRLWGHGCNRIDRLNTIPAADVRPVVRGKWIRRSDDSCVATCSVCGNENNYAFCIMSLDEQSLVQQDMFCPFCGADMREAKIDGCL